MRPRFQLRGVCLAALVAVAGCAGCSRRTVLEPIRVAQLIPLSGSDRLIGQQAEWGARLALEDLAADQAAGQRPLVLWHVDTKGDPEIVAAEAVRLLRVNRAAAFLSSTDLAGNGRLVKVSEAYGVPLIASNGLPPDSEGDVVMSVDLSPAWRGQCLARLAGQTLKLKTMLLVSDGRDANLLALATAFSRSFREQFKGTLREGTYVNPDHIPELVASSGQHAQSFQGLLFAGRASDLLKHRPQIEKAGLRISYLLGASEADNLHLLGQTEASEGIYSCTILSGAEETPQLLRFGKRFRERSGMPPSAFAVLAYDSARLLGERVRQPSAADPAKAKELFSTTTAYESLTGPLSIGKDHYARRKAFLVRLVDGKLHPIVEFPPEEEQAGDVP